jgi:endonuclease G
VVSVDSIESITGIDFFHELPDEIENELESKVNLEDWEW